MAHAHSTHATQQPAASPRTREARRLFFKADHPREIDQYIDYFGGVGAPAAADDLCGETVLERLA